MERGFCFFNVLFKDSESVKLLFQFLKLYKNHPRFLSLGSTLVQDSQESNQQNIPSIDSNTINFIAIRSTAFSSASIEQEDVMHVTRLDESCCWRLTAGYPWRPPCLTSPFRRGASGWPARISSSSPGKQSHSILVLSMFRRKSQIVHEIHQSTCQYFRIS